MNKKNIAPTSGRTASDMKRYIRRVRRSGLAKCVFTRADHQAGVKVVYCRVKGTEKVCSPILNFSMK